MLQFLNPAWLGATASVAVPIAIHLWNRRQPRVVQVGSIRWLQSTQSRKLSSLQLTEPWLLLLRCLLLIILGFGLAGPQWKREISAKPEQHVYLHPELLQSRYLPQIATTIDSLATHGWQVHRLQPGFPVIRLDKETPLQTFQTKDTQPDSTNAWAMLRVLNRSLPSNAKAWIFTTDLLRHHRGELPQLRTSFTWIPVSSPQTTTWLQEAFYTSSGQLLIRFGTSNAQQISFEERRVAKPTSGQTIQVEGLPALQFSAHSSGDSLTLTGETGNSIAIAASPLRVFIRYNKARQADVRYLRAALQTALEYRGQAFQLTTSSESQQLPTTAPDWIFWLTDEPLVPFLTRFPENKLKTLQDAPTNVKVQAVKSWLQIPTISEQIALQRRVNADTNTFATVLWQDGFGKPLLTHQKQGFTDSYRFYSRFNPSWNVLPDNGHFPELLLQLLFQENNTWKTLYDARTLPKAVETPTAFSASFSGNTPKTEEVKDLLPWLVVLAALLFAVERWIAGRRLRHA